MGCRNSVSVQHLTPEESEERQARQHAASKYSRRKLQRSTAIPDAVANRQVPSATSSKVAAANEYSALVAAKAAQQKSMNEEKLLKRKYTSTNPKVSFAVSHAELLGRCWDSRSAEHQSISLMYTVTNNFHEALNSRSLGRISPHHEHDVVGSTAAPGGGCARRPSMTISSPDKATAPSFSFESRSRQTHVNRYPRHGRSHWVSLVSMPRLAAAAAAKRKGGDHEHRSVDGSYRTPCQDDGIVKASSSTYKRGEFNLNRETNRRCNNDGELATQQYIQDLSAAGAKEIFAFRISREPSVVKNASFLQKDGIEVGLGVNVRRWDRVEYFCPNIHSVALAVVQARPVSLGSSFSAAFNSSFNRPWGEKTIAPFSHVNNDNSHSHHNHPSSGTGHNCVYHGNGLYLTPESSSIHYSDSFFLASGHCLLLHNQPSLDPTLAKTSAITGDESSLRFPESSIFCHCLALPPHRIQKMQGVQEVMSPRFDSRVASMLDVMNVADGHMGGTEGQLIHSHYGPRIHQAETVSLGHTHKTGRENLSKPSPSFYSANVAAVTPLPPASVVGKSSDIPCSTDTLPCKSSHGLSSESSPPQTVVSSVIVSCFDVSIDPFAWKENKYQRAAVNYRDTKPSVRQQYGEGVVTNVMYGGVCILECSSLDAAHELERALSAMKWTTSKTIKAMMAGVKKTFRDIISTKPGGHKNKYSGNVKSGTSIPYSSSGPNSSHCPSSLASYRILRCMGGMDIVDAVGTTADSVGSKEKNESLIRETLINDPASQTTALTPWVDLNRMASVVQLWSLHLLSNLDSGAPIALHVQRFIGILPALRLTPTGNCLLNYIVSDEEEEEEEDEEDEFDVALTAQDQTNPHMGAMNIGNDTPHLSPSACASVVEARTPDNDIITLRPSRQDFVAVTSTFGSMLSLAEVSTLAYGSHAPRVPHTGRMLTRPLERDCSVSDPEWRSSVITNSTVSDIIGSTVDRTESLEQQRRGRRKQRQDQRNRKHTTEEIKNESDDNLNEAKKRKGINTASGNVSPLLQPISRAVASTKATRATTNLPPGNHDSCSDKTNVFPLSSLAMPRTATTACLQTIDMPFTLPVHEETVWERTILEVRALENELQDIRTVRRAADDELLHLHGTLYQLQRAFLPNSSAGALESLCTYVQTAIEKPCELPGRCGRFDNPDWLPCMAAVLTHPKCLLRGVMLTYPIHLASVPQLGVLAGLLYYQHATQHLRRVMVQCGGLFDPSVGAAGIKKRGDSQPGRQQFQHFFKKLGKTKAITDEMKIERDVMMRPIALSNILWRGSNYVHHYGSIVFVTPPQANALFLILVKSVLHNARESGFVLELKGFSDNQMDISGKNSQQIFRFLADTKHPGVLDPSTDDGSLFLWEDESEIQSLSGVPGEVQRAVQEAERRPYCMMLRRRERTSAYRTQPLGMEVKTSNDDSSRGGCGRRRMMRTTETVTVATGSSEACNEKSQWVYGLRSLHLEGSVHLLMEGQLRLATPYIVHAMQKLVKEHSDNMSSASSHLGSNLSGRSNVVLVV